MKTYYVVCFQTRAKRLFSAAPMLRAKEQSQNVLIIEKSSVGSNPTEVCNVVAVTAEKNVAIVDILSTPSAQRFCSYCMAGKPVPL